MTVFSLESGLAELLVQSADFHPAPAPFSIPELIGEGFAAYRQALDPDLHPAFDEVDRIEVGFQPDLAGKGFSVAGSERASAFVKTVGIRLAAFIMVGFPDETKRVWPRPGAHGANSDGQTHLLRLHPISGNGA